MRRFLMFILMILLFRNNVNAKEEVYYSDYSDFGEYTEQKILGSDVIDVKEVYKYKYYKEVKEFGDYYIEGHNEEQFPYIDRSDFIISDYTPFSDEKPLEEKGRELKTRNVYHYSNMKKIRYIHLTDFWGTRDQLNINEIIIRSNSEYLPYNLYCEGCSEGFYEKVSNKEVKTENSYVLHGGYIRIDLRNYYDLSDLEIRIYITDLGTSEKGFQISTSREQDLNHKIFNTIKERQFFTNENISDFKTVVYKLDQLQWVEPEWEETLKTYDEMLPSSTRMVDKKEEYSYRDTYYKYYNLNKKYADGYYLDSPIDYPLKDVDYKKTYYQFRERDKVVISSSIIISDKNQKLEEFIISNSTNKYIVNSNINYNKNGKYTALYEFPFITVEKEIIVDIPNNHNENTKNINTSKVVNQELKNLNKNEGGNHTNKVKLQNKETIDNNEIKVNIPSIEKTDTINITKPIAQTNVKEQLKIEDKEKVNKNYLLVPLSIIIIITAIQIIKLSTNQKKS